MISHKHKFIFIHVPKCAGTSIERQFGHIDLYDNRNKQDHRTIRMIENPVFLSDILQSRDNMKEYFKRWVHNFRIVSSNPNNRITVSSSQYENYFKFTIIRNPFDRTFSCYKGIMRDQIHLAERGITNKSLSFRDYVINFLYKDPLLRSQLYYIENNKQRIPMDFIVRFEKLDEDMKEVYKRIGVPYQPLPHELKGGGFDYKGYYDDEIKELVHDYYRKEIELFSYEF